MSAEEQVDDAPASIVELMASLGWLLGLLPIYAMWRAAAASGHAGIEGNFVAVNGSFYWPAH